MMSCNDCGEELNADVTIYTLDDIPKHHQVIGDHRAESGCPATTFTQI